jgi:serine O-acetyltransferase
LLQALVCMSRPLLRSLQPFTPVGADAPVVTEPPDTTSSCAWVCRAWRRDAERYRYYDGLQGGRRPTWWGLARAILAHQGLQASSLFRLSQLGAVLRSRPQSRPVGLLLAVFCPVLARLNDVLNGIWISPKAEIGPGLYIGHYGGVIIGAVRIGENCNIGHGVTIGRGRLGEARPTLGDRVMVAAGAKLLGSLDLGDDVLVGANAVVTRSFGDRAVLAGDPVRVLSHAGSFEYLRYPGCDDDPRRRAALSQAAA